MKIKEGYTLNYIIHGVAGIIIGLVILYINLFNFNNINRTFVSEIPWFHFFVGLLFITIGVLFILVKTGVEIDIQNRKIRAYQSLFNFTKGNWFDLAKTEQAFISNTRGFYERINFGGARTHRVKTFELILVDNRGYKDEFYSFLKKKLAFETLDALQQHFNIQIDKRIRRGKLNK